MCCCVLAAAVSAATADCHQVARLEVLASDVARAADADLHIKEAAKWYVAHPVHDESCSIVTMTLSSCVYHGGKGLTIAPKAD